MSQDDWVRCFAEVVRRQRYDARGGEVSACSDRDLILDAHRSALAQGETEIRAWRAAVGAYLERHPGAELFTAERIVTYLMRPQGPAPTTAHAPE